MKDLLASITISEENQMFGDINANRFTVVTPVLNGEEFVEECLDTVASQSHQASHIVVDGGSTDGTLDIVSARENVRVLVEPKSNIYEALNLGIKAAETDYVCFLNCDDYYYDARVLEQVHQLFQENPDVAVIYGQCDFVDAHGRHLYFQKPVKKLTFKRAIKQLFVVSHPSCFFRKSSFEQFGLYDPAIRLAADCEFIVRLLHEKQKFFYLAKPLSKFRLHQNNASILNNARQDWEQICAKFSLTYNAKSHYFWHLKHNLFNFGYLLYLVRRRLKT